MLRKALILTVHLICVESVNAQENFPNPNNFTISYKDWSNPLMFRYSPAPFITGYGVHSDSLEEVHGSTFYELDGEYLAIETWADYYYWFTQKYDILFRESSAVYRTSYFLNDISGMIRFVYFNNNYKGDHFPSQIRLFFKNKREIRSVSNGHRPYSGTPYFDELGMYRPDLIERRWLFRDKDSSLPFILSGRRGNSIRSEGSTERSDN